MQHQMLDEPPERRSKMCTRRSKQERTLGHNCVNANRSAKMRREGVVFVQRVFIPCRRSEVSLWRELTAGPLSRVARRRHGSRSLLCPVDHPHERRNRSCASVTGWSMTTSSCRRPETKTHDGSRAMQLFLSATCDNSSLLPSTVAAVNLR